MHPGVHMSRVLQGSFRAGARHGVVQASGRQTIPVPSQVMSLSRGGGQALPTAVRRQMESALGANFGDVRVHVGSEASRIGAIAFTTGTDIYFAHGQYNPATPQGQALLGHELVHVIQQRAGRVRNPYSAGLAVVQDAALEAEADRLSARASRHAVAPALQRKPNAVQSARCDGVCQDVSLPCPTGYLAGRCPGPNNIKCCPAGTSINDDAALEHEADVMGARAAQLKRAPAFAPHARKAGGCGCGGAKRGGCGCGSHHASHARQ